MAHTATWSKEIQITDTDGNELKTSRAPRAIDVGSDILLVWIGEDSSKIYYSFYDTLKSTFSPQEVAKGPNGETFQASGSPALEFVGDQVLLTWTGEGGENIWYSVYDVTEKFWANQQQAVDVDGNELKTSGYPALAKIDSGNVLMTWNGTGGEQVWMSTFSVHGIVTEFTSQKKCIVQSNASDPILATDSTYMANINGKIVMVWTGKGGSNIWYSVYNIFSGTWENQDQIKHGADTYQTSNSPCICTYQFDGFLVWLGTGGSNMWYGNYQSDSQHWTAQHQVEDADGNEFKATGGQTAATVQMTLYLFWRGEGGNNLWMSSIQNPNS